MNKKLEDMKDLEELNELYEYELSCLEEIRININGKYLC